MKKQKAKNEENEKKISELLENFSIRHSLRAKKKQRKTTELQKIEEMSNEDS